MRRATTPTNTFTVDIDLTGAKVWITYSQAHHTVFEKEDADLTKTATKIQCTLTQEETYALAEGAVEIQICYITPAGAVDRSNIIVTTAERILKDEIVEY